MSYSPFLSQTGFDMSRAESHLKIRVKMKKTGEEFTRTVMTNEGKRYVTINHKQVQVKKLKGPFVDDKGEYWVCTSW